MAAAALECTGQMWVFTMGSMFWLCYLQPCCAQSLLRLSISISLSFWLSHLCPFPLEQFRFYLACCKLVKIIEKALQLLNE